MQEINRKGERSWFALVSWHVSVALQYQVEFRAID